MRWKSERQSPCEWHRFFALFPTRCEGGIVVWLEYAECRMIPGHDGYLWEYRPLEKA